MPDDHRNMNDRIKLEGRFAYQGWRPTKGSLAASRDPRVMRAIREGRRAFAEDFKLMQFWGASGGVSVPGTGF